MSEKQTHTQGPWHCGQLNGEGAIFANNGKRLTIENGLHSLHPICHVQNTFGKEDQANARLIAAAPELLVARILKEITCVQSWTRWKEKHYEHNKRTSKRITLALQSLAR